MGYYRKGHRMSLSVGLLFNGIHGFGLAAEQVGMECAWLSEIDSNCNKLMNVKRPSIPNLGDITKIERVGAVVWRRHSQTQ